MRTPNFLICVLLFIGLSCVGTVDAKSPVWKVTKGDDYLYLGGTIHMLSKNDYPLPAAFESAYENADHIWFEADMSKLSTLETQMKMLKISMYQDQQTLSSVLSPEVYRKLTALLEERKMPMAMLDKLTPVGLMITLTALELQRLGLIDVGAGVDLHFEQRAKTDGKQRLHLESVDEQLSFIDGLNDIEPDLFVESVIDDISMASDMWTKLLAAWKEGDAKALEDLGVDDMKADFPLVYQKLLVERNNNWLPDIKDMLRSEEIEFVLVGALHMAGKDGLLKKLSDAGYQIQQLD